MAAITQSERIYSIVELAMSQHALWFECEVNTGPACGREPPGLPKLRAAAQGQDMWLDMTFRNDVYIPMCRREHRHVR